MSNWKPIETNFNNRIKVMSNWKPIETYDKLKKKPDHAIFWMAESKAGEQFTLKAGVVESRTFGRRAITHWMRIEPPK
jgi:hypothetical protein